MSDEGSRADLDHILAGYRPGWHAYTCGPDRYMDAVMAAAGRRGFPEEARHLEYFSVPELPDYENHPFTPYGMHGFDNGTRFRTRTIIGNDDFEIPKSLDRKPPQGFFQPPGGFCCL